jgi:hypothetical protein
MRAHVIDGAIAAPATAGTQVQGLPQRIRAAFRRSGKAFMAAQERRARALAAPYLARQSDKLLRDAGFTAEEIAAIRRVHGG